MAARRLPKTASSSLGSPLQSIEQALFPIGYKLLVGTSQIYELELALAESKVLSREDLLLRGAYFESIDGLKTHHFRMCAVSPLQVDSASSARRRTFFEANLFKTGYATHGLFPYRGKFHPQLIKAVVNIIGLRPGDTLLDPMMGSGTACLEATLQGINAIGIDASPFCVLMAEGKQAGASATDLGPLKEDPHAIFDRFDTSEPGPSLFAPVNGKPRGRKGGASDTGLEALLRLCYLDAMGYAERRKKKTVDQLFPVVLGRYVNAVRNFARVRDELGIEVARGRYLQGDARDLKTARIKDTTIDGIITSPPYSFAIDYLSNDAPQLHYLGVEAPQLRSRMIGLRGEGLPERVRNYLSDMASVLCECARVLKAGRYAVVVVGTNSNQLKRVMGTGSDELKIDRELVSAGRACGLELEYDLIHPIEGIHNTLRDEHVLFFRKR
jgi:hypothetical protein